MALVVQPFPPQAPAGNGAPEPLDAAAVVSRLAAGPMGTGAARSAAAARPPRAAPGPAS